MPERREQPWFLRDDEDEKNEAEASAEDQLRLAMSKVAAQDDHDSGWTESSGELESIVKSKALECPRVNLFTGGNYNTDKLLRLSDGSFVHVDISREYDQDRWSASTISPEAAGDLLEAEQIKIEEIIAESQAKLEALKKFRQENIVTKK